MKTSVVKNLKYLFFGLILTAGIFLVSFKVSAGELKFHALYVGSGDCLILESNGHFMLVDSGYDVTAPSVLAYLKQLNIPDNKIDYAIATHPDQDHVGGFSSIFDQYEIGEVIYSPCTKSSVAFTDFITSVKEHNLSYRTPVEGETWKIGDAAVQVIYDGYQGTTYNECSIVLKATCDKKSVLLMADLPTVTANSLIKQGYNFKADILKVGHHGAASSTSADFLNIVNPSYAVISASEKPGADPAYPRDSVLKRLANKFIKTYRTVDGNICITIKDGVIRTNNKEHNDFIAITRGTLTLRSNVFYSTGKKIKPPVTLTVNGAVVPANQYKVKYSSNTYAGMAAVKVTGSGAKYIGSLSKTFMILPSQEKLTATLKKPAQITLSWKAQKNVSGYTIVYSTDKSLKKDLKYINIKRQSTSSKTLKNLAYDTSYYFKIRAYRSNLGFGKWSKKKTVKTSNPYPLQKKIKKLIQTKDQSTILKWNSSGKDLAKGFIIQYSTGKNFKKKTTKKIKVKKHSVHQVEISKLKTGQKYYYRIRGYNKYGNGPWSKVVSFRIQ